MSKLRPRRSVLYMPAANERALEKAKGIPADAIIFDLEDAVSPDAKDVARGQAVAAANSGEYGKRELTIRCNALDTPWGKDDIAAAAKACVTAVVIPKVSSVAELDAVSAALDAAGAPKEMMIWAMIETPTAILDARAICAHPRVAVCGLNPHAGEGGLLGALDVHGTDHPLSMCLLNKAKAAKNDRTGGRPCGDVRPGRCGWRRP